MVGLITRVTGLASLSFDTFCAMTVVFSSGVEGNFPVRDYLSSTCEVLLATVLQHLVSSVGSQPRHYSDEYKTDFIVG